MSSESEFPYHKNDPALASNPGPLLVPTLALDDPIDTVIEPDSTAHIPTETPLNTPTPELYHLPSLINLEDLKDILNLQLSSQTFIAIFHLILSFYLPMSPHHTKQELEALEKNNTWEIVHLLEDERAIGKDEISQVKHRLDTIFTIKDLGPAKYFLSLEIARSTARTSITQHKFIRDIIQDASLLSAKPASIPLSMGLKLSSHTTCPLSDPEPYRRLVSVPTPTPLYCDNQAAIQIVSNSIFHEHTEHLKIDCHLVREKYKVGFVLPQYISGKMQLTDMFTKSLSGSLLAASLSKLGLVCFSQVHLEGGLKRFSSSSNSNIAEAGEPGNIRTHELLKES
ncbi:UNVERIFIED_CONTAM: hypothetical protein Slati_3010200 [Sesamum latifolium]|uniref:Reverse transcriptase Ty1/copia-type domain-containing protein n=1 Tax=Sesamum latifolium TaxID=2727402 RepID=A0AAW2VHD0_9LAMI